MLGKNVRYWWILGEGSVMVLPIPSFPSFHPQGQVLGGVEIIFLNRVAEFLFCVEEGCLTIISISLLELGLCYLIIYLFLSKLRCCCSVLQSCLTLCNPMDCSTPDFPVLHHLLKFAQTHVHRVSDANQLSHLSSPSPPAFNLSQHQGLFQSVSSSHQVAKVLELQLQHQSFQ